VEFDLNRRTEETFIRPPGTGVSVILPPASKLQIYLGKDKGKSGFVERLVVNAPLRRSCMARVLKGSHRFTCTPRVHRLTEWTVRAFSFPAEAGTHLPTPEGWKAELALGGWLVTYWNRCPAPGITYLLIAGGRGRGGSCIVVYTVNDDDIVMMWA